MKTLGPCHVQPLSILCTLITAGFLLVLWRGTTPAQQLDPAEVTHREYQEFILATGRVAPDHWDGTTFPPGSAEEPVTMVTWYDARDYCTWRGKRLPSQDEWSRACHAKDFPKRGNIWEWTQSEEQGWKILCGPQGICDCSHQYRPTWKNAVKGFRCTKDQPMAFWPLRKRGD
jgi:Sulfatase-modifying factor enzyme 1